MLLTISTKLKINATQQKV